MQPLPSRMTAETSSLSSILRYPASLMTPILTTAMRKGVGSPPGLRLEALREVISAKEVLPKTSKCFDLTNRPSLFAHTSVKSRTGLPLPADTLVF